MENDHSPYTKAALERIQAFEKLGKKAYPHNFRHTHTVEKVKSEFGSSATSEPSQGSVSLPGRLISRRGQGAISFADIYDQSGTIQLCVRQDVAPEGHQLMQDYGTVGSIIGVTGRVFLTRTMELTILADSVEFLSHNLQPLPDKRRGLQDVGVTRNERYVELLTDASARERFQKRSQCIWLLRKFMNERNFLEVETPVLDSAYGGAEAKPFLTHVNALHKDLYLRVSPELNLKRLLVGGLEHVFEIGKQFRNEGLDSTHHPEFTSLEVYQAYADYHDMMDLTEEIISHLAKEVTGSMQIPMGGPDSQMTISLEPPFERQTYFGAIEKFTGYDVGHVSLDEARGIADELGVCHWGYETRDEVAEKIFEAMVEDQLVQPTFIIDYPASICPLTKRHRTHEHLAERFELFIGGTEFANAYSELNDPREQRRHFQIQEQNRLLRGDELAHPADWDYVRALEFGMPPAGGLGIGIDRLVMLLTGVEHIQDIILFPLRR